ncbi:hypothetical protein N8I74_02405 [Chitiniphilus purpureus]|uniref:Alginate export domain-containing protein n=1 Tax=Chitiniphilus purpureus TaxID=2981137 RepID=A0ABY6DNU6_9NEIS|nr:hypothetical protein [Chitiniphilus sp. CD1]UXY15888.1 hypothetical protein N8I74_02405 [Chitiniphilus sp. CD1]
MAHAQPIGISGEVAAGVWSSSRMLDDRTGVGVLRGDVQLDWQAMESLQLHADLWARSAPERLDHKREDAGITELYLRLGQAPCAPALGKRLVLWGRTDAINPTDQVAPRNFRRLTPDDDEQRSGQWGLHLDCQAGPGKLQLHWMSQREFNQVPLREQPGVVVLDAQPAPTTSFAAKYDVLGEAADWSIGFVRGADLHPTLAVDALTPQGLALAQKATRFRMLGADVAFVRGEIAYRAEFAWVTYDQDGAPLTARRRPYVSGVAGGEWALGDRETLGLQLFWKHLHGDLPASPDPIQQSLQVAQGLISNELDDDQYGVTARYARSFLDSRADLDLFAVWSQPSEDWMLRGRLSYAYSDHIRLRTGFDVFRGLRQSYLGNLRQNALLYFETSYIW